MRSQVPECIAAYAYQLPFAQPLQFAHGTLTHRSGLLLKFQHNNQISWGEAAPLPGFSAESLADVLDAFHQWQLGLLLFQQLPASLQFAIEMGQNRFPLAHKPVATAFLLSSVVSIEQQAALSLLPTGQIVKLKVGRQALTDEIAQFQQLREKAPQLRWRLDANRNWSLQQALEFCQAMGTPEQVEFIEEPCADLHQTIAFAHQSRWPVALDETTQSAHSKPFYFEGLQAIVCKPGLVGNLTRCSAWAELARQHQLSWIISSAFESNLAHAYLAALAIQWAPQGVHGLDTLQHLAADLLVPRSQHSTLPVLLESDLELIWQA